METTVGEVPQQSGREGVGETPQQSGGAAVKFFTKAMELPLVPTITGTVSATSDLISKFSAVTLVTDRIAQVGERQDVKSLLSSVNSAYESTLATRVENLKQRMAPAIQSLDDMACGGIDKINDKVNVTHKVYVEPVMTKLQDVTDTTITCSKNIISTTKKVTEDTAKVCSGAVNYSKDIISSTKKVTEDTAKVCSEAVNYSRNLISSTKDVAVERAAETVQHCKEYLLSARDSSLTQVVVYTSGVTEYIVNTSNYYATEAWDYVVNSEEAVAQVKDVMRLTGAVAVGQCQEWFPTATDMVLNNLDIVSSAAQTLFGVAKVSADLTLRTYTALRDRISASLAWTRASVVYVETTLHQAALMIAARGEETARKNADTIQFITNRTGLTKYLEMIGYQPEKLKFL